MSAETKILPPKSSTPLSLGVFAGVLLGATALGAGTMIFFFNPSTHAFYPICVFHALTGLNCPGCGMTRALYALLHGNWLQALKDNALLVGGLVAMAGWGARLAVRKMRHQRVTWQIPSKILWLGFGVVVLFGVLRNLPGFAWLSP